MLAKLHTFSLLGIDELPVEVEVDVSPGALPKTVLVGLPEQAVKESTHRIERAMVNSGFVRPQDRSCLIGSHFQPERKRQPVGGGHVDVALARDETGDDFRRHFGIAGNILEGSPTFTDRSAE
jgi:hypothetical protein